MMDRDVIAAICLENDVQVEVFLDVKDFRKRIVMRKPKSQTAIVEKWVDFSERNLPGILNDMLLELRKLDGKEC